jgi:hypothetical protein
VTANVVLAFIRTGDQVGCFVIRGVVTPTGHATFAVAREVVVLVVYPERVPVTATVRAAPWSALVRVYVDPVAPEIDVPLRFHW